MAVEVQRVPLVSICLPNLNTRQFLEDRMETILSQTLTDWELIVCDNYSDDGSWEFFQRFNTHPRICLYQIPRKGMYANWNECLQRATGRYIYMATSDDTMRPECLERLATALEEHPALEIALCDFEEIDAKGEPCRSVPRPQHAFLGEWLHRESIRDGKTEFLLHAAFGTTMWVTMTSVLFRRTLLKKTGLFRTDSGSRADEEWTLRASLASDLVFVPGKYATWRIHASQATGRSSIRDGRGLILRGARSVIYGPLAGIPSAWKRVPSWDQELLAVYRRRFLQTLRLRGPDLLGDPRRCAMDAWAVCRFDPRLFAYWARSNLPLARGNGGDAQADVRRLLRVFDAPWPPRQLPGR